MFMPQKQDSIKIKGGREHNLKNVDLEIPKNKLVVMTGVSGSGKSSLAFDTIYAEGQRRYVESLSAYARQFLGTMTKPDVDQIDGLSPAISIDQKTVSHNPRSTVGTITEIYDYLRLLFARIGTPHCPNDGIEITRLSVDEIIGKIASSQKLGASSYQIISPVARNKKGEFKDLFENIKSKGYKNVRIDGVDYDLSRSAPQLPKQNKHSIDVVIDTLSGHTDRARLANSVEQALTLSDGLVIVRVGKQEKLFSEKFSCPKCGFSLSELEPRMFSFNSPLGACEKCRGIGTIYKADAGAVFNKKLSINEGGILPFSKHFYWDTWLSRRLLQVCEDTGIDTDEAIGKLDDKRYKILFESVSAELEKRFASAREDNMHDFSKYLRETVCDSCHGDKLKPEILAVTIDHRNIARISNESVQMLIEYLKNNLQKKLNAYETKIATPIIKEILVRLSFLNNVGLSYLTISRYAKTLSGGELQRIRLASQIGTGLTGVLYVLDEPSIGLHPKDVSALINTLKSLRDLGNSLIIVEHDPETIEAADYIVELGPKAGKHGGHITFTGTIPQILKSNTLTGLYLSGRRDVRLEHTPLVGNLGKLKLSGASEHNLKNIEVEFPLGNLIAITGVSGSGKSTLITETLYPALKYYMEGHFPEKIGAFKSLDGYSALNRVYLVDQSPIGRTPRSNPATYIGFFDDIRDLYASTVEARARGFAKGRFSFNLKGGRCEKCQGGGLIKIEMQFLPDVYVTCDVCRGRRYNEETLSVKYKNKSIDEILKMTVEDALTFFRAHPDIHRKLEFLKKVGLDYIELGQPAPTFSGGEAQRMKLVNELSRKDAGKTLYILDEPTTGLHFYDIEKLLHALQELVKKGNTVIVIEHNLEVIKNCQYIIDLGPEGGDAGGQVLYQGETSGILKVKQSHTAKYLKKHLKS